MDARPNYMGREGGCPHSHSPSLKNHTLMYYNSPEGVMIMVAMLTIMYAQFTHCTGRG